MIWVTVGFVLLLRRRSILPVLTSDPWRRQHGIFQLHNRCSLDMYSSLFRTIHCKAKKLFHGTLQAALVDSEVALYSNVCSVTKFMWMKKATFLSYHPVETRTLNSTIKSQFLSGDAANIVAKVCVCMCVCVRCMYASQLHFQTLTDALTIALKNLIVRRSFPSSFIRS